MDKKPRKQSRYVKSLKEGKEAWLKAGSSQKAVERYFSFIDPVYFIDGKKDIYKNKQRKLWILTRKALEFAERPDALSLIQFCAEIRLDPRSVRRLAEESPYLKAALSIVKTNIAARLYQFVLKNPAYTNYVTKVMSMYDPFYKEMLSDFIRAKNEGRNKEIDQKVVVELVDYSKNPPTRKASEDREEEDENRDCTGDS